MTEIELQSQKLMNQERVFKLADFLSKSDIIPKHFQGKPANVFIALEMANRLQIDFFELANGLYVVHGTPAFSGTFTIGRINASRKFKTKLNFKTFGSGNDMKVTASAVGLDGERCEATVGMDMAIAEGWTKNTKYKTMPEQMLTYRAATFFCRKHCPEVLLGAKTVEEVEDVIIAETTPSPSFVQELKQIETNEGVKNHASKYQELMKKAAEVGIPESTLSKINPDLKNESRVKIAIEMLHNMISDRILKAQQQKNEVKSV